MARSYFRLLSAWALGLVWMYSGVSMRCFAAEESSSVAAKPVEKLDLRFVPSDAVVAIVIEPRRILESPQAEQYPTELVSAAGKRQWGLDPLDIQQALVVIGLPESGFAAQGGAPPVALVLHFSKAIDTEKVM